MGETGKDQVLIEVAANLTRFYTFMAHALRFVTEDSDPDQITLEQVEAQLKQTWAILHPRLVKNPVMKGKLEKDYNTTLNLTGDRKSLNEAQKKEAIRLQTYAREKAASLSDLVAIFRSL
jgi:hypothetical protein